MCGIVGCVNLKGSQNHTALVKAMADLIGHRGPDDQGFFFADGIALGHRRLSIIDLKHGHQPMMTNDRRFVIVYNGEVYNYLSLRHELESLGEVFLTTSDTEVLIKAFRQWGAASFNRFQGMFAIVVWDNVERTLHLARDHIGIKPLYYIELNGELIFASEIKALFCHPDIKRQMDYEVVAAFLSFNNTFGDRSFWLGVKRCLPGERLEYRDGQLRRFRFFDIGSLEIEPFEGKFEEAGEQYRELIHNSVIDHLASDVPLGAYLSGGIDSASVALMAAKEQKEPLQVFTGFFEGYEGGWYDETSGAQAVADKGAMTAYKCPISSYDFQRHIDKAAYHLDEPTLGSGAIAQLMVAKFTREKVKVVLTGHGGDELFAGYPVFKALLMREKGINIETIQQIFSGGLDEWMRKMYFFVGGSFDSVRRRGQFRMFSDIGIKRVASIELINVISKIGGTTGLLEKFQPFQSAPTIDGAARWYIATYLPTLLIQEDKISMAYGLESRVPICYIPLLRFALSLSADIKLNKGELKAIPRFAMRSTLPKLLYSLPKRGFPTPIVGWLSGQLGKEWECQWNDPLPAPLYGLLNPKGVCKEFKDFREWGRVLPNSYALAHRLISLQMLRACALMLQSVQSVNNLRLNDQQSAKINGTNILDK